MTSSNATSPSTGRAERHGARLRVGLTGGIASGKSTVAALFEALGVPIIDTDLLAREAVLPGSEALGAIVRRFGDRVLAADGSLDRRTLRQIAFADDAARRDLEALIHPAILALTEVRSAAAGGAYQIVVVPLLAEKRLERRYDRVLVVDCDPALQLRRLMVRDAIDAAAAAAMLAAQAERSARLSLADDVIHNDGDLQSLSAQVAALHRQYLELAARRKNATIRR
jgi:dephospho-CoA kinase